MRITYIGFGDFHRYAGMKQLYHFAQEISRLGHKAQILLPGDPTTVAAMDEPPLAEILPIKFHGPLLAQSVTQQVDAFRPDILHVWTPRHVPALVGTQLSRTNRACVIVDHEDDEDYHVTYFHRMVRNKWSGGWRSLMRLVVVARNILTRWATPLRSDGSPYYGAQEPITWHSIAALAHAHTAISPNLAAWAKSQWPHKPVYLLYPGARLDLFTPDLASEDLKRSLGLVGSRVLVYSGTMSVAIFQWFLDVLGNVISEFPDVTLLLVGEDSFREQAQQLASERGLSRYYRLLGQQPYAEIPRYLSLGDVLLQHPLDLGNEMRLPAKLPEYLAMGKPIVTFAAGIGRTLIEGVHVRKLVSIDPLEAASVIQELLQDSAQCERLGASARIVATERFDWSKNGKALTAIYKEVVGRRKDDSV